MKTFLLISLSILVAFFGLLFTAISVYEYNRLAQLRRDFDAFQQRLRGDLHNLQKAMQRVIASYQENDLDTRIQLLNEAVAIDPSVFNGYNALGYAYLERGDVQAAIDAFREAVTQHPEDKAGYFDLATAYYQAQAPDLVRKYLERAMRVDGTAHDDIAADERFRWVLQD